jgi:regulator of sigma E protease
LLVALGIILFLALVVLHELGHFWVARRNGVQPEEFGIFFPPRLWHKKMKSGFELSINLLPLGGFVKLKGEHDNDTEPGTFGAASNWAKTKIMLAGVFINFLTAIVLFTILALVGMPKLIGNQFTVASDTKVVRHDTYITYVDAGSPASKAGLQVTDKLLSIVGQNGKSAELNAEKLPDITKQFAGQEVTVRYERGGKVNQTKTVLRTVETVEASKKAGNPIGYLGVVPLGYTVQRSTWSAPVVAFGLSGQITVMTAQGLWHAVQGLGGIIAGFVTGNHVAREQAQTEASSQVSGPVGIFFVLKTGSVLGLAYILMIIAILSLTLAIMNVLPIPALDGGRLYLMLASRLTKKKRLTEKMEETIVGWSFILLIGLIILITIVDVRRFF